MSMMYDVCMYVNVCMMLYVCMYVCAQLNAKPERYWYW